jgi:protein TonB
MTETENLTSFDRLGLALLVATLLHALLILGVSFTMEPPRPDRLNRNLEIVLSRSPAAEQPPADAEFLADASREASGEGAEETTPVPTPRIPEPEPAEAPQPEPEVEQTAKAPPAPKREAIAATRIEAPPPPAEKPQPAPEAAAARPLPTAAELLASTDREIERLTLELARKEEAYAGRPRHKAVSASTQEYKYANYLYGWKKKVEAIGNLNYPEEAKRRKLYGNLVLTVVVRADGTIEEIRVVKSSGYKLLDDAAVRIVKLAAPFAPFPADIRAEADMLDITRTWQFLSGDRLRSK